MINYYRVSDKLLQTNYLQQVKKNLLREEINKYRVIKSKQIVEIYSISLNYQVIYQQKKKIQQNQKIKCLVKSI